MSYLPPWYAKIGEIVAPTDRVATITLIVLAIISIAIAIAAPTIFKIGWAVYLVAP